MAFWARAKVAVRKTDLAVGGLFVQSFNVVKEAANRGLGLPELAGQIFGLTPTKRLRLRVVILRDEKSLPLAEARDVLPSVEAAQSIFERQARIKVLPLAGRFVETLDAPSPADALDVHCDYDAWKEGLREAGNFFETYLGQHAAVMLTGYAAPVTAFVVRHIEGKAGCSLGPLSDYITVAAWGLSHCGEDEEGRALPRLLAHEVGHACGLWHVRDPSNLMHPLGPGVTLRPWQKAILRNSRHVTHL
jgi:Matrixin